MNGPPANIAEAFNPKALRTARTKIGAKSTKRRRLSSRKRTQRSQRKNEAESAEVAGHFDLSLGLDNRDTSD